VEDDRKAREQVDRVFKKLDLNQDGVITIEEFIESCLKVEISFMYFILQLNSRPGNQI
jgi:Ca2+-binding EF-hand superfamily protein